MATLLLLDTSGPLSTVVLARAGFPDLDGIGVLAGPGSYTGLRVAVAAAKGFCYALGLPLLGVNKLALLARQAQQALPGRAVLAALPARAGEWFAAAYSTTGAEMLPPAHRLEAAVQAWMDQQPAALLWTGSPLPESALPLGLERFNEEGSIDAACWSRYCHEQWEHRQFESLASFVPFYLKAPFVAEKKHI